MGITIAAVIGLALGVIVSFIFEKIHISGNLRVDHSIIEDEPYLFLELNKSVNTILRKKFVVLQVKAEDFIPHE